MRVLAVGAHPDDIEILCAGTLLRYRQQGHEVVLCVATNGEQGHFVLCCLGRYLKSLLVCAMVRLNGDSVAIG
ncbi:MAG: hypothetical protein KatS3mg022_0995 [Armatimonadota bacterium]|nr:MAG: hypothetical protein KatS3mg022_0995 [Armatimonadota bacterium]